MSGERTLNNSPEQNLWQSVLLLVVQDALHGAVSDSCKLPSRRAHACQSARDYLTTPSRDLSMVCAMAGLDMQAVIDNMTRQIAAAPTPEELAASPFPRRVKRTPAPAPEAKRYTYDGESLTLKEWSVRTGLSFATLRSRMSNDWPLERALTEPVGYRINRPPEKKPRPAKPDPPARILRPAKTLTHAGETMTLKQWAARLGLSKPTIEKRLRMGWPIDQVLSPQNMRGKSFAERRLSGNQP